MDHPLIRITPTYLHSDDVWPMMITATHDTIDVVRWYSPDGGTDIGVVKAGAKDELLRKMYDHLLLYENKLREAGYTFVPHDWPRLMAEAGCEVRDD